MNMKRIVLLGVLCLGLAMGNVLAKVPDGPGAQTDSNGDLIPAMSQEDQGRRLQEAERSLVNLQRQIDRLGERFEKLDRDLENLKRKV